MERSLAAQGLPFDVVRWGGAAGGGAAAAPNLTARLYDDAGLPKYYGIAMIPNIEALGAMTRMEVSGWLCGASGSVAAQAGAWPSVACRGMQVVGRRRA